MKVKTILVIGGLGLALAFAFAWTRPGRLRAAQPALAAPAGMQEGQRPMGRERHPAIRRALGQLEAARATLQRGAHDFGGHRVKAIQLTNDAIRQLQIALRYDKH